MSVLSAQSIRKNSGIIQPFNQRTVFKGMTYGLSSAGYDIRIAQDTVMTPGQFIIASSVERFNMPNNILGRVSDKSTWARQGVAVQNTIIEPGWRGHLTLELTNHSSKPIRIFLGSPIAQIIFEWLDEPTDMPYQGKYQDQEAFPITAKYDE